MAQPAVPAPSRSRRAGGPVPHLHRSDGAGDSFGAVVVGQQIQRGRDHHRVVVQDDRQAGPQLFVGGVETALGQSITQPEEPVDQRSGVGCDLTQRRPGPGSGQRSLRLILQDDGLGGDPPQQGLLLGRLGTGVEVDQVRVGRSARTCQAAQPSDEPTRHGQILRRGSASPGGSVASAGRRVQQPIGVRIGSSLEEAVEHL